jgi:lipid-binding SYLF domain-containing protein
MIMIQRRLALALVALSAVAATPARADDYTSTIAAFRKAEASGRFFKNAHGYAVFPTIGKGGVGIGGAYGKGKVYEKGKVIGSVSMSQLSIGFQLGGQGFSQIIFFEDTKALKAFTAGEFEFGAEASAVAITAGASAKAGSTGATAGANVGTAPAAKVMGAYVNGMAVFTLVKGGLMYEATISGQKFKFSKF